MVHAFIIHTLLPGSCRVLYARRFSCEGDWGTMERENWSCQDSRLKHRKQIEEVASLVHSEYQFRRALTGVSVEDDIMRLGTDEATPELELGFCRLQALKYFYKEMTAVWLGAGNSGFTMVCDKTENLMLAETVLRLIIRHLQEYVRVFSQHAEVALKSDRIGLVLEQFLPNGTLLFMHSRVIRQFEKELETVMKG